MNKLTILAVLLFLSFAARGQQIPAYTADKLMQRVSNKDTTYIVNFWATWCAPCVKELPEFNTLAKTYRGKPVKVILASFDFKEAYPAKLSAFVQRKQLQPEVVWWSETNANEFIPKIDSGWSGGLPATMVINAAHNYHVFLERPVQSSEIMQLVEKAGR